MSPNLLLPLLFACTFQSKCLPIAAKLEGGFDLKINTKNEGTPPYAALGELEMPDRNKMPAARHHIISRKVLRDFYSKAIEEKQIIKLPKFLEECMKQFETFYGAFDKFNEMFNNIKEVFKGLDAGTVFHKDKGQDPPKGYLNFIAVYMWLPQNLFLGPRPNCRSDDQGGKFEKNSEPIIGQKDFNLRKKINDEMEKYIKKSGPADFKKLDDDLESMMAKRNGNHPEPKGSKEWYSFNKDHWVAGTYEIKVPNTKVSCVRGYKAPKSFLSRHFGQNFTQAGQILEE